MKEADEVTYPISVNISLWLSVALFLIGIVETFGFVEVVSESFRFPLVGPCLVILAIALSIYPYREIKKEFKKHKENNNS